jgi:hypothetical protein
MGPLRRPLRLVSASVLVLLCAACGGVRAASGTSGASCLAPYLNDQSSSGAVRGPVPTVSPGDALTIYGHWYTSTCNDTGGNDPLRPLAPVRLTLTLPGGAVERLGTFKPRGDDMGFSTTVHIPEGTPEGTAKVHDDRDHPATYRFKIGT